jgi:hypothetical protein
MRVSRSNMSRLAFATLSWLVGCGSGDLALTQEDSRCAPPHTVSRTPQTIEDTVDLINALHKPLTVPCLLASLDRPFGMIATSHQASAQPPEGPDDPRVFLILGDLWLSVVTKGKGRPLLEFGVRRPGRRSLKGELLFPIEREVSPAAPYARIDTGSRTVCANCHVGEDRDETIDFARGYVSQIVDPPPESVIGRAELEQTWSACDAQTEPDRCAMFDSILGHGEVFDATFD